MSAWRPVNSNAVGKGDAKKLSHPLVNHRSVAAVNGNYSTIWRGWQLAFFLVDFYVRIVYNGKR